MAEQGGAKLTGRAGRVWELYAVQRWTQDAIAEELGITQQRVSQIVGEVRAGIPATDLAEMRQQSIEHYAAIIRKAHLLAEKEGAPVTAGKDGDVVRDPDDNSVVRDYALRIQALKLAADAEGHLRKLLGLDAAEKLELSGAVRYELVGIDPEDLT